MPRDRDLRGHWLRRVALLLLAAAGVVVLTSPAFGYPYDERPHTPSDVVAASGDQTLDRDLHPVGATEPPAVPRYDDNSSNLARASRAWLAIDRPHER